MYVRKPLITSSFGPVSAGQVRKFSHLFFVLGALSPYVSWWVAKRARRDYEVSFGEVPEGTGLFGIFALGAMATFTLFVLSAVFAIRAYQTLDRPRAPRRKIELTLLCVPPLAVIWWVCFGLLGLPQEALPVIQTR